MRVIKYNFCRIAELCKSPKKGQVSARGGEIDFTERCGRRGEAETG